jgi:arylsulfatase
VGRPQWRSCHHLGAAERVDQTFLDMTLRPNPMAGMTMFTYGPGVTGIGEGAFPNTHRVPFGITVDVDVPERLGDGVLAAIGGVLSGWSLYVKDGKPTFSYNLFDIEHMKFQSSEALSPGKAEIKVNFTPVDANPGSAADVRMLVNGKEVAKGRIGATVPFRYGVEPFDVGMDTVSAVSDDYSPPFPFPGRINAVTIDVK